MSRRVGAKEIAMYLEGHQKQGGSEKEAQLGMTEGLLLRASPDHHLSAPVKWKRCLYEALQQNV
jgi:hypothetical protein